MMNWRETSFAGFAHIDSDLGPDNQNRRSLSGYGPKPARCAKQEQIRHATRQQTRLIGVK